MPIHRKTLRGFRKAGIALALGLILVAPKAWSQSLEGQALPVRGANLAVVEIVEVGDFECPHCAKTQAVLKQVLEAYPQQVRLAFLHQPLPFHDQALQAALASRVAQKSGKFWEMADTFFAEQSNLSTVHTRRVAMRHGITLEALNEGLKSPEAQAFIEANKQVGIALGVTGTPAFFINGTMVRGAKPFASFKKIIDIEIAMAGKGLMTAEAAAAYRQSRTRTNSAALHAYLYEGKAAPKAEDPATQAARNPTPGADNEPLFRATIRPSDPFLGDRQKALVTLVSFVGYQCSHSRTLMNTLSAMKGQYGDDIGIVLKHLPLSIHPLGREAAVTALCAAEQGKFWEVNRALFADNQVHGSAVQRKAQAEGLDMVALQACADAGNVRTLIREDGILAQTVGARGTPTTFINGRQIVGAMPAKALSAIVDAELARVRASVAEGQPITEVYPALMQHAQVLEPLEERVVPLDMARAPTRGNAEAPVQLVVFADYQCPYCASLEQNLQQVYQRYAGRVAVTVKHFPLSFHKAARPAAEAAYCAYDQEKFWPMHDGLSVRFEELSAAVIQEVAAAIGLDMTRFGVCLSEPTTAQAIDADIREGQRIGLMGTPTLLFNGQRYDLSFGASPDDLSQTIDRLLNDTQPAP
ncbi:MAG: DsbA family protein [Myxococcota bacterium]